jgi:hypothetical protein
LPLDWASSRQSRGRSFDARLLSVADRHRGIDASVDGPHETGDGAHETRRSMVSA